MLVLAGIHGVEDGSIGRNEDKDEDGFVEDSKGQVRFLKRKFADDIEQKKIEFKVEDVGQHRNRSEIDPKMLSKAVNAFSPTVIVLAFCWSEQSELNDILRSAGIYTGMIMRKEREDITEGWYVVLDDRQKEIIKSIAEEKPGMFSCGGLVGLEKLSSWPRHLL